MRNASYRHDDEGSLLLLVIKWFMLIAVIVVGFLATRRR